ncbi:MAG: aminotransferase class V-fold PLP-dependent enzyme [Deltaproteobacteria bacterium]|nr:aminotransferase class V-fold PLP-dependent enzyme [Deltaproteobacteria bacterium]
MSRARLGDRSLFPRLQPRSYLNHAAISPPSEPVRDAVLACLDNYASRGLAAFVDEMQRRDALRSALARWIGAGEGDVALVANTSTGVVDVALCLPWQPGDRVLLFRGEFPTNVTPWQQAARRHGLEIVWQDADAFRTAPEAALAALRQELARGVRLCAVSAVQFQTGLRMPLAAIGAACAAHGCELFVDAIQALGVVPLDVRAMGIHYLAAGGHKWLMGPEGLGVLYVEPAAAARLRPEVAAWMSHDHGFDFLSKGAGLLRYDRPIHKTARMVEGGAPNVLGTASLQASLGLLDELGQAAIYDHVQAFHDAIEPGLLGRGFISMRAADPDARSGILSLVPPTADAPLWSAALARQGISVASPDGLLRLAPHWPNGLDEVEAVLAAVDAVLTDGGQL